MNIKRQPEITMVGDGYIKHSISIDDDCIPASIAVVGHREKLCNSDESALDYVAKHSEPLTANEMENGVLVLNEVSL